MLKRIIFILTLLFCSVLSYSQATPFTGTVTGVVCTAAIPVSNKGTATFDITGSWTGTIQAEKIIAANPATNIQVTPVPGSTAQNTITANGTYTTTVAGFDSIKFCGATVTGTATISGNSVPQVAKNVGTGAPPATGTVTNFGAGDLSPLFTTGVATATTTPVLSFTLSNAAANTVLGNPSGSPASPSYTANPSVTTLTTSGQINSTGGPFVLGTSTPSVLSGFSTTDDNFGTKLSAFAIQLAPLTSATTNSVATFNLEPADGVTTGQSFNTLNVGFGSDATQTKNFGTVRSIFIQNFPQTTGTITTLIGEDIANNWGGSGAITTANALRVTATNSGAAATASVTTNIGVNVLHTGWATNPSSASTITTDAAFQANGPSLTANGTMTHHYGYQCAGNHTGGTGNADGWCFFDATATNKEQFGIISATSFGSIGTKYTLSANACSATTTLGGASAGSFVSGASGACTVTILMGNSATAANGWHCTFEDHTTPANFLSQTGAADTTHCSMTGTTVSGDLVSFSAMAY